jgi:hypothetical protein
MLLTRRVSNGFFEGEGWLIASWMEIDSLDKIRVFTRLRKSHSLTSVFCSKAFEVLIFAFTDSGRLMESKAY